MSHLKGIASRVRSVFRPGAAEQRMEEEFAFHVEMETARLRAEGLSEDEARRLALVSFGGRERHREEMRDERGARLLADLGADLRYAWRVTRASPGVAIAVALTLGVGIGVNGFAYSMVDGILVRPIPARAPEELVGVFPSDRRTGQIGSFAYDDYEDLRDRSGAFAGLAGSLGVPLNFTAGDRPAGAAADLVWGEIVTENYFSLLGMTPALGRFFTPADAPQGANPFAVLSHAAWRSRFGGDSGVVGRAIRINGTQFTITGVAPRSFRGIRMFGFWPELWVPAGMHEAVIPGSRGMLEGRGRGWILAFGRLNDGWDIERTRAAAGAFARRLEEQFPDVHRDRELVLIPARSGIENPQFIKLPVIALSSALGIVATAVILLIICANLANLQLARSAARSREFAIRLSLGCSRRRLVRQLLVETFVLALPGLALAAAIVWASPLIETFMLPRLQFRVGMDLAPNARIVLFTTVVALATILLLGLVPAIRATRTRIAPAPPSVIGARRSGRRRPTVRGALVVSQLALSVVLLVGGALFIRSLIHARALDVGFDTRDRLLLSVNVGLQRYDQPRGRRFYDAVLARVRERPDVVAASWAFPAPFDTHGRGVSLYVDGAVNTRDGMLSTDVSIVSEDFVDALGLRLRGGRGFEPRDSAGAPAVMVVSQSLAARLWPGEDPIGKRARRGDASGPEIVVVGLVDDATFISIGEISRARAYIPLRQRYADWQTLIVHVRGNARAALPSIRDIVTAADPTLPVFGVTTMEDAVASGRSTSRTAAGAAGFFGVLALLIAAVGLYAVVASSVAERTREIGLRMALGSTPAGVIRFVMANGARLGAWGLLLGIPAAVAAARGMAGLLVGISPFDWMSFAVVPVALLGVVLAATYLPARRAVRLDPMTVLRTE